MIGGPFSQSHGDEIVSLARNEEKAESAEHPLNRIMSVSDTEKGIEIRTTDIHLPQRIGRAIKNAYDGELDIQFENKSYFIRVSWTR